MYKNVSQYVDEHFEKMVSDIVKSVKIPSVSSDKAQVDIALAHVINLAREMGFSAKTVCGGMVGLIEAGEGSETLGILAHIDVVPASDLSQWTHPPFEGVVDQTAIWGRGTIDDKGPLISSLYALKAVTELKVPLEKKVQIIIGTQEEVDWVDIRQYVAEHKLPDYGFTPDGEFPLCNIEKGAVRLEIKVPVSAVQGAKVEILSINGGEISNAVPSSCVAILQGDFAHVSEKLATFEKKSDITVSESENKIKVMASGHSTHSCQPENGDNAIIKLCNFLSALDCAQNGIDKVCSELAQRMSDVFGQGLGLYSASEYFEGEFVHRNAMSANIIKTQDSTVSIYIDMRTTPHTDVEYAKHRFEGLAKNMGGEIVAFKSSAPVFVSKEHPFMQAFAQAYDEHSGHKNEFALAYGGSYAKAIPNVASWGPIFPGEHDTCHEPNERILLDNLRRMTKVFAEAIKKIALSKESFLKLEEK